ncbi:MAG: transcription termination/antitermination NusG family protein, partial [Bacteroidaceae bacterium]
MKFADNASIDDNTHGGGEIPPCTGLTPGALPEVQEPVLAENSQTGGTSDVVSKENHEWFVLRILYGHTKDVVGAFKKADVLYYIPKRYQKVEIAGKKRLRKESLLPSLVFAYMTRERTHDFVKQP